MTETAPKRYSQAMIIHLILFSLFLPTFDSEYWHPYYQDFFLTNLIAVFIIINILLYWKLDFKQNAIPAVLLTIGLALYNAASFYNYHANQDRFFWKNDHYNVTVAFLFFIILLVARDVRKIISHKTIKWAIGAIVISNLIALILRAMGYSRIRMTNRIYWLVPFDESNNFLSWLYFEAGEYAFALLLGMAFFMIYKDHFKNIWIYLLSQAVLLLCMFLTNSSTFLLATAILFGSQLIDFAVNKYHIRRKHVLFSFPAAALIGGFAFYLLFQYVDTFHTKYLIWKGNWKMLLEDPFGLSTTFGVLKYYVNGVEQPLDQAHNVFLNHMLRHTLPVGSIFTLMFIIIILCSVLSRPTYRTIGIWTALLIPLNMNYSLQTVHLPFTLFMLYCIFFRPDEDIADKKAAPKPENKQMQKKTAPEIPIFEILDLDENTDLQKEI